MNLFCLKEFKVEFEKLKSKKSYSTLEEETIAYFFNKSGGQLLSGVRLNNSDSAPYIKKRLAGRGGFRFYYLLIVKGDALYLMFVHPKTGAYGAENITDESKAFLYKKVLQCIESGDLFKLSLDQTKSRIIFEAL